MNEISVLDVGHGNSTIMHGKGETVIIDCGAQGSGLLPFLTDRGIKVVKTVFLSHADQDHIAGLLTLLLDESIEVQQVYLNGDGSKHTKVWDDLVKLLDADDRLKKISFTPKIDEGDTTVNAGDLLIKVMGPSKFLVAKGVNGLDRTGQKITTNSISASFIVSFEGKSLVYASGDIDKVSLDELIHTGANIEADVLIFPHHGGDITDGNVVDFTELLLKQCKPSTVVFSIGRNRFRNPRHEVVAAVRRVAKDIRISCTQLSKNCSEFIPRTVPTHLHPYYANGRYRNVCCGGTFVITIKDDNIIHHPEIATHQEYVTSHIEAALCKR